MTAKSDVDIGKMLHFINISQSLKYSINYAFEIFRNEIQNTKRIFSSFS
jgi:hypothetical protein